MRVYEAEISYKATLNEVEGRTLNEPAKVYEYLKDINELYPVQETFWVVFLTTRRHPIARQLVTLGTATASLAHPREVFKGAILAGAVSIIVAHNLCDAPHRLCYVACRTMCSERSFYGDASLCAAA